MANESITFSCPACGIKLKVPGSLAGVTGPCPTCRTQIQAPYRQPASTPVRYPPIPTAAAPADPPAPAVTPLAHPLPSPATVAASHPPTSQAAPPALQRESRQLPGRSYHGDPVAKQMPGPNHSGQAANGIHPRHSVGKNQRLRFLVPLFFLIASVAVGFGVATLIRNRAKEVPGKPPATRTILPHESGTIKTPDDPRSQPVP